MDLSTKQEQRRQNTEGALLSPVRISHISPERLKGSLKGRLSDSEFKHLAVCPRCREALSEAAAGKELLTAPRDLRSSSGAGSWMSRLSQDRTNCQKSCSFSISA